MGTGETGAARLSLPFVAETMAQASVRGARGNSGMMLSQFLLGFREGIGDRLRAGAGELAHAIGIGFERLRGSLDEPIAGTILTVAREAADEASRARGERDLRVFMRRIVDRAEVALQRTPELLAALKSAGVVDAGAKGFVRLLDGVKRLMEEGHIAAGAVDRHGADSNAAATAEVRPLIRHAPFSPDGLEPAGYSLVTCFQTIEHLDEPLEVCRQAHALLKEAGANVVPINILNPIAGTPFEKKAPLPVYSG